MARKILFIYPSSYDINHNIIKSKRSFFPSRTLPYLAALTPARYETYIIDELLDSVDFNANADLVALTGMLRHMPRAFDIAAEFRRRGKTVIIGGVGAFAIQGQIEKSKIFNSLVIGEADELWDIILQDFERGRLKETYECNNHPELRGLPPARFDLLNVKRYLKAFWDRKHPVIPIETSRGCPHNCRFCLVTCYFGKKMRYRPIDEVVAEIKYQGAKCIFFTDDNIAIDPGRAKELFLAIKPLHIQWLAQCEARVIEHPNLLRLAAESGCVGAVVGIESLFEANLYSANKLRNIKIDFKAVVKSFKEAEIPLIASIIFGFENDTPETIKWTIDQMIENDVDAVLPWLLTPLPKTPFYDECRDKDCLIHENYSLYDFWHPVIRPNRMSPEQLEKSFWQGLKCFYSLPLIFQRMLSMEIDDIGGMICHFYFHNQIRKKLHPISGNM